MAAWLRSTIGSWWGKTDNSPGLPTYVPPVPLAIPPVEVVVVNPPAVALRNEAPAFVVIEVGSAAFQQPPPIPKLREKTTADPVLPMHNTGEFVQRGSPVGSPANHRANRCTDLQRTPKEISEQDCLTKLQQLESDPSSGLRDADKAFYKIMLAKKTADPLQARSRLLEALKDLDSAQKLTQENNLCPQPIKESWLKKIQENQIFLNQVAVERSISLDPKPFSVLPDPTPAPSPEKSSPVHASITYMVVGIIALLGSVLVGWVTLGQFRNITKL